MSFRSHPYNLSQPNWYGTHGTRCADLVPRRADLVPRTRRVYANEFFYSARHDTARKIVPCRAGVKALILRICFNFSCVLSTVENRSCIPSLNYFFFYKILKLSLLTWNLFYFKFQTSFQTFSFSLAPFKTKTRLLKRLLKHDYMKNKFD